MKHTLPKPVRGAIAAVLALATAGCWQNASAPDYSHGEYLVTQVCTCQDCHSPRDERGAFLAGQWLQGTQLPFQPTVPMPWNGAAPNIAGLAAYTDGQALRLLTTGVLPDGRRMKAPMPEVHFTLADARDVLAYLRSPRPPVAGPQH